MEPMKFDPSSNEIRDVIDKKLALTEFRDGGKSIGTSVFFSLTDEQQLSKTQCEHAHVTELVRGDMSTLEWVQSANEFWNPEEHPDESLCHVYYTALNFRDIMLASGRLPPEAIPGKFTERDCLLGMEFAGKLADGRRVMGMLPAQALATTIVSKTENFWPIPDKWTMEEAATVPIAYATAYYSLMIRGKIKPSEKILIHSGSGGVGQAAIAIALANNCEVFVTVGTEEKKNFLLERFPALKPENFASSRTLEFETKFKELTNGKGVDVILNSLSEEKLQASVRLLARNGRFLEIGKFDLSRNNPLHLSHFNEKQIQFHGILLDSLQDEVGIKVWKRVMKLLDEGKKSGVM